MISAVRLADVGAVPAVLATASELVRLSSITRSLTTVVRNNSPSSRMVFYWRSATASLPPCCAVKRSLPPPATATATATATVLTVVALTATPLTINLL